MLFRHHCTVMAEEGTKEVPPREVLEGEGEEADSVSLSAQLARVSSPCLSSAALPAANIPNGFSRLRASTDLNAPPSNWLLPHPSGADGLSGFRAAPARTGFSSLWMASRFVDFVRRVDVMAEADNIKRLLKLPYSRAPVSLVVHRVGRTLLLDDLDVHGFLLRRGDEEERWRWLKRFFLETVLGSLGDRHRALVRRKTTADALQRRNLESKFLYRSLLGMVEGEEGAGGDAKQEEEVKERTGDSSSLPPSSSSSSSSQPRLLPALLPPLPEPSVESRLPDPKSTAHEFARNLLWNFEDIRMLIGSDMPIFGDAEHPSVSLRLHKADRPINVLTGLDYWLDNLMCQVPEVLMCYHLDGIVQNYELVKTEDLPDMEGCKFSPGVVRDVAKNILSFLKTNAAREGHTYWLFKGKDDDVVKLYDLTSLCMEGAATPAATTKASPAPPSSSSPASAPSEPERKGDKGGEEKGEEEFQNPFRTAVSMLLYKVARNILQHEQERHREEKTARLLLVKCLLLLDENKFPHIATSAHFMLSDLYVPDDVNPASPSFGKGLSSVGSPPESSLLSEDLRPDSTKVIDMSALRLPPPKDKFASTTREEMQESSSSSFTMDTKQRCLASLSHVVEGLRLLEHMARRREEDLEAETRKREREERDNLRMAQPSQAIPMGYDDPALRQVQPYQRKDSSRDRAVQQLDSSSGIGRSGMDQSAPSWHDHLKKVLLRKAFLVYITLSEVGFSSGRYGDALRCIKRALNCYHTVNALARESELELTATSSASTSSDPVLAFAYGVAGDSYMSMVRTWDGGLVDYQEQYNNSSSSSEDDSELADQVEKHVGEAEREALIKMPRDIEEAMLLSRDCLRRGADLLSGGGGGGDKTGAGDRVEVLGRLGNVCNELGSFYMNQMTSLLPQMRKEEEEEGLLLGALSRLREQSRSFLDEGLSCFEATGDSANLALLLSNSGRLCRLYAFAHGEAEQEGGGGGGMTKVEVAQYRQAISHYERALAALRSGGRRGRRKSDSSASSILDTVNWEYSTTLYTLATQLQDYGGPPDSSLTRAELRRQVMDFYGRSLKHCEVDSPGPRQHLYLFRAASIHHRIGTMHQGSLLSQESGSDGATAKQASQVRRLAEYHFEKAARGFLELEQHGDFLRSQLHRVTLAESGLETSSSSSAEGKARMRHFALVFQLVGECLPCLRALEAEKFVPVQEGEEGFEEADKEARDRSYCLGILLQRIQHHLLTLNKTVNSKGAQPSKSGKKSNPDLGSWAKELYGRSLQCRPKDGEDFVKGLASLTESILSKAKSLK